MKRTDDMTHAERVEFVIERLKSSALTDLEQEEENDVRVLLSGEAGYDQTVSAVWVIAEAMEAL